MNKVKQAVLALCALAVIATGAPLQAATPEESFKQNFAGIPLESITPTDIPGIFEIVSGGRVAYYIPEKGYLLVGEIITKDKKNLTQERNNHLLVGKFKDLPLEKAVKIGSGLHKVIEITDPDCPFCRKASEFFAKRNDVTRYTFLYPIASIHPNAEAKIKYIFCAKDKAKAYEEAMTGKLDDMKFKTCDDAAAAELLKTHKDLGDKIGMGGLGTPLFVIDSLVVRGANFPEIEKALTAKK